MARSTLEGNAPTSRTRSANLAKARAVADNDARQAERMKTLFERGLVSATDYENARTNAESSQAMSSRRRGPAPRGRRPDRHRGEPGAALPRPSSRPIGRRSPSRGPISPIRSSLAPFAGYVAQRNLDQGAAVSAQSAGTNTSSVGILVLHDIETVKVQIEVPERDIARVRVGSPVRVTVDPYQGEAFAGSVARSCTISTRARARWAWRWRSPNPAGGSSPACSRASRCWSRRRPGALTVPARRSVWATPSRRSWWSGRRRRGGADRVGLSDARGVEVLKGLGDEDQVILQGKDLVSPGRKSAPSAAKSVAVHVADAHRPEERIAILMASLAIVILGARRSAGCRSTSSPNINFPSIHIGTVYKGANVQDIERTVTYPIEKAVSAVCERAPCGVALPPGLSVVEVCFTWGADLDAGLTEVVQRIQQIMNSLPTGVQQPFILKFDLSNIPVCLVTLSGGGLDEQQLYDLAYNTIEPQLERLAGVASANVDGGKIRQITVNLNRDLLYAKGISVTEVARAVNDSNFLLPVRRHEARQPRLQRLHQQPVLHRRSDGEHRGPHDVNGTPIHVRTSARRGLRGDPAVRSSASTASGRSTCA